MYRGRKTKQKKTGHGGGLSDGGASGLVMKKKGCRWDSVVIESLRRFGMHKVGFHFARGAYYYSNGSKPSDMYTAYEDDNHDLHLQL